MKCIKTQKGLTLVELLTTVSILSIVIVAGVPSLQSLHANNQRASVMFEFTTSVAFARGEAARRRLPVTLCASTDGASCSNGEWNGGWITFVDADSDKEVDVGEEILRAFAVENPQFSMTGNAPLADGLTIGSTGFPTSTGSLDYCDDNESRDIDLTPIGRLKVAKGAGGCS